MTNEYERRFRGKGYPLVNAYEQIDFSSETIDTKGTVVGDFGRLNLTMQRGTRGAMEDRPVIMLWGGKLTRVNTTDPRLAKLFDTTLFFGSLPSEMEPIIGRLRFPEEIGSADVIFIPQVDDNTDDPLERFYQLGDNFYFRKDIKPNSLFLPPDQALFKGLEFFFTRRG